MGWVECGNLREWPIPRVFCSPTKPYLIFHIFDEEWIEPRVGSHIARVKS